MTSVGLNILSRHQLLDQTSYNQKEIKQGFNDFQQVSNTDKVPLLHSSARRKIILNYERTYVLFLNPRLR